MTSTDRHEHPNYPYRPDPSDLLKKLDEVHGTGRRSKVLSDLLRRYLAGQSMPKLGRAGEESGKPGQESGA